jgi:hypothetical protein
MAGKKWTQEEIGFIKSNYMDMTCEEMAKHLGRTRRAVQHLFGNLGLKRDRCQVDDRFERLVVKKLYFQTKYGQQVRYAKCICDCNNMIDVKAASLVQGHTKSCGCLKNEKASERCKKRNYKHGKGDLNNRLYRIWCAMKSRCRDKSHTQYHNYGGRGISVCKEWCDNYVSFYNWSIANGYKDNLTIDRTNNNGNYEPSNCRWVDHKTQARNRNNNRLDVVKIVAFEETKTLQQWLDDSRCMVKSGAALCYRIGAGWKPEDAISKPSERS